MPDQACEDTRVPSAAVGRASRRDVAAELEAAQKFSGVVGIEQGDQNLFLEAFGYASRAWSIRPRSRPVSTPR
ncbi:MAG TPA: hypothetical protein VK273_07425, partial [Gaiellaceae bacterium]|nr:hypothetical protein [Gaiellaceae bacterium]